MSAVSTSLAWALSVRHPGPARRPPCEGSRLAMAAGCVCAGTVVCPRCRKAVDAEPWLPRAVRLVDHPEGVARG